VGYFTISHNGDDFFDEAYLNALPAVEETKFLRLVHFERPVVIKMDGKKILGWFLNSGECLKGNIFIIAGQRPADGKTKH
jgi:hypothetical protein